MNAKWNASYLSRSVVMIEVSVFGSHYPEPIAIKKGKTFPLSCYSTVATSNLSPQI